VSSTSAAQNLRPTTPTARLDECSVARHKLTTADQEHPSRVLSSSIRTMVCLIFAAMPSGLPFGFPSLCNVLSGSDSRSWMCTRRQVSLQSTRVKWFLELISIVLDDNCDGKEASLQPYSTQKFEEVQSPQSIDSSRLSPKLVSTLPFHFVTSHLGNVSCLRGTSVYQFLYSPYILHRLDEVVELFVTMYDIHTPA